MRRILLLGAWWAAAALAQTTQGLIAGRVIHSQTGAGVAAALVTWFHPATNATGGARCGAAGYFVLPLLAPGAYRLRVAADQFQPQELQELELPVAARVDLEFRLRPLNDVWEAGQYRSVLLPNTEAIVTFYGPDVDTSRSGSFEATRGRQGALESTVSDVIDPAQVRDLPLSGRDLYTMLVTQPGVTADTGTARGLGLSISGQRPSSSNFLLDGVENNNYLVTGPLAASAPEAVQEYRVSTNNFTAEYGRTAGFLANAVTRSGGAQWHGTGYFYLKNEALNANGFQENRLGLERPPAKQLQPGYQAGGPLRRQSVFLSTAFERLRSRGRAEEVEITLPSTRFADFTAPGSRARSLLERFPAPPVTDRNLPLARLRVAPPASLDRSLALERIDYHSPGGAHRILGRVAIARTARPDFIWSPYKDFVSPLEQNTYSVAGAAVSALAPSLTSEARASWSRDHLAWDRPHPEIPTLFSGDGTLLPGSLAFYEYRNRSRSIELAENLVWASGRHIFKAGGGALLRRLDGLLTAGRDALWVFGDIIDFVLDSPVFFSVSADRASLPALGLPQFDREYQYNQYFLFAQDTYKAAPRLALNYGLRYESFGSPRNTGGVKDGAVELGAGSDLAARLGAARLVFPQGGAQPLYAADRNNWAARFGFAWQLPGRAGALLRGAFGIFYDRPFDNLWQNQRNNNLVLAGFPGPVARRVDYLAPVTSVLSGFQGRPFNTDFPPLTLIQPGLRDAHVQSYFLGLQHRLGEAWAVEVNTLGSLGRKLITTDAINRSFSHPIDLDRNPDGRLNPALPPISYRANQGSSNYHALTAVARYRPAGALRRGQFQLAYTWSHSIDNQSEALAGDFFDLSFTRVTAGAGRAAISAFSRQFDSRIDRGSSDFDQRQNLVFFSIWDLPSAWQGSRARWLLRDWRFSQLAAFRTGFPFTVHAPSRFAPGGELIYNNRAELARSPAEASGPAAGGRRLLDPLAFREPEPGRLGSTGRNAFRGPGLFNIDLSLSRSLPLRRLGEAGRVTLRADVFNFLNHANLNNPESFFPSEKFGLALYGRQGRQSGFPALTPLNETARQFQLILRVEF